MTQLPIRSIRRGDAPTMLTFSVGPRYAKITEELKDVRFGDGGVYKIVVYRVYDTKGDMVAELESCSGLVILYGTTENVPH